MRASGEKELRGGVRAGQVFTPKSKSCLLCSRNGVLFLEEYHTAGVRECYGELILSRKVSSRLHPCSLGPRGTCPLEVGEEWGAGVVERMTG